MHALNGFQRDVLDVVAGLEEAHGLAITDELDVCFPMDINLGRLYPNLDTPSRGGGGSWHMGPTTSGPTPKG